MSVGIELAELLTRELELLTRELELLTRELELLETLDELRLQIAGKDAQYSSLQVSGGQSGQLLPCGQLNGELLDDLLLELRGVLEGSPTDDELRELLFTRIELLERLITLLLAGLLDAAALQTAPVITGFCAGLLATPLLPCRPNSIVWPGLIRSFQPTPLAVNGLLPETLAFQLPVRVVPSV